ncbi:MAG: hypothetical protein AVDCRST_MAG35-2408 [uncultured Quadrisphaera sp.]|uniref:Polysaccharide chain length determinant N-terminal domain-containing protein n=1 Tax=uncultured Quadrisphaera sp. TaxID=904978 RepID=A0A6J4PWS4_9ACTN|nr:MAG: hypothetical protein AVDCRST_MAG35-2408 [uncultured Quadrisphaera sp.]
MEHSAQAPGDPRRTVVLSTVAKALPVIVGVTAIFGAGGILLSRELPVEYTATSRVVLSETSAFDPLDTGSRGQPTRFISNQLEVLQSAAVLDEAAVLLPDEVDPADAAALRGSIDLAALADTDVITITATAPTGEQAAARANAVAAAYPVYVTRVVAEAAAAATAAAVANVDLVAQISLRASVYGDGVASLENATVPSGPSAPRPLLNGFLLAALGALVSTGLVIWRRGQPLADRGVLVESVGAPVLGVVPVPLARLGRRRPPLPRAHDFSMSLVALGYVVSETSGVLMVTGIRSDSGSPTVALGLAAAAAEQHHRVVVVEAEARAGELLRHLGQRTPPLPLGALADPAVPEHRVVAELEELRPVRGEGSVHLASLVGRDGTGGDGAQAVRGGLQRLVDSFDMVVLHVGPIAVDPMAFALLRESALLVAVVDERARTADLLALRDKLDLAGATSDGLVLARPSSGRRRRAPRTPAPLAPPDPSPEPEPDGHRPVEREVVTDRPPVTTAR